MKRENSGDMREILLHNGARLFATRGYAAVRIADIVSQSGVTQAAFYWYFKSKLEMALEIIRAGRECMVAVIRRGYREHAVSLPDMASNTRRWLCELISFADQNRHFMAILYSRMPGADPLVDQAVIEAREALYQALQRNIAQAVQEHMLPSVQGIDLRAMFVHRLIEGGIEWWLFGHRGELDYSAPISADEMAARLTHYEFFGLCGEPLKPLPAFPVD